MKQLEEKTLEAISTEHLSKLEQLYDSLSKEKSELVINIAHQASKTGKPNVLEWCFNRGFYFRQPSFNDEFYFEACAGRSPAVRFFSDTASI